jgi:hypothetical protein
MLVVYSKKVNDEQKVMEMNKKWLRQLFRDRHGFLEEYAKSILPSVYYKRHIKNKIRRTENIRQFRLSSEFSKEASAYWQNICGKRISLDWHRAYIATSGISDIRYVPEDLFYQEIEQKLNRLDLARAYQDKNNYDRIFSGYNMPRTVLRNMNGKFYDEHYNHLHYSEALGLIKQKRFNQKLVLKPSIESGGGRHIVILDSIDPQSNAQDIIDTTLSKLGKDYIVQEYVSQCSFLRELHESSLNTLRIMTLRLGKEIHVLSGIVRMGNLGSNVDNATAGGLTCGFNKKGLLNPFATEHYAFQKHEKHPYSGFVFEGAKIPNMDEIIRFVQELHQRLLYFDIVSWDIAIDESENPVLIEVNLKMQDINFHQRNNGPLFGDKTESVMELVFKNKGD